MSLEDDFGLARVARPESRSDVLTHILRQDSATRQDSHFVPAIPNHHVYRSGMLLCALATTILTLIRILLTD